MRLNILGMCTFLAIISIPFDGLSKEGSSVKAWSNAPSIYVDVGAETWKTRGRLLYDIEGSVLRKLASAGFQVVRHQDDRHELTLVVRYREERGEQYDINAYGTVIHGKFYLDSPQSESSWQFTVSETSYNSISGPPPYLDALERFETNPYYFFLGDILRGHVRKNLETRGGLLFALERMMSLEGSLVKTDRPVSSDMMKPPEPHAMPVAQELYATTAVRRTLDIYVNSGDRRVIPLLFRLIHHQDPAVRIGAIEAFGALDVKESRSDLMELSQKDLDPQVRQTAKAIFENLNPSDIPH